MSDRPNPGDEGINARNSPVIIYYWIHHTGVYDGNSGVQRVVRALGQALARRPGLVVVPVRWCGLREAIVTAEEDLVRHLAKWNGPIFQVASDPGQPLHLTENGKLQGAWLILPEVPHVDPDPDRQVAVPVVVDYARYYGLKVAAVFYDLIPIRMPGYEAMREAHSRYAFALAGVDLVLPISHEAGRDLAAYWRETHHDPRCCARVHPVPLAAELVGIERCRAPTQNASGGPLRLLALGTVEPRKNQVRLMEAVNRLAARRPDLDLRLDVVGHLHPAVEAAVTQAVDASEGRIAWRGYLPDEQTRALTEACDATVFVSLFEGFGLPITESLWLGKPCICSNIPPMTEIAQAGGCLLVDPQDDASIEYAIERFAGDAGLRRELTAAACDRGLTTWDDYGHAVLDALVRTPDVPHAVVVEGSLGDSDGLARAIEETGTQVRQLRWRTDTGALIPAARQAAAAKPGDGDLNGCWAILPVATVSGPGEALRIEQEARGLGLKIALLFPDGRAVEADDIAMMATVDLILFASAEQHEAAVALAFASLPKTATLRQRMRSAGNVREALYEIFLKRARTSGAPLLELPRRVFYFVNLTITQTFNTGVQRVVRSLGKALLRLGVEVVPVKLGDDERFAALTPFEIAGLAAWSGPDFGTVPRLPDMAGEWLILPEITCPNVPYESNVPRLAKSRGMRVASILYDLIPVKSAHIYNEDFVNEISDYLYGFSEADLGLPISYSVAGDLRRFLAATGRPSPRLAPCPLAGDLADVARQTRPRTRPAPGRPFRFVAIGTREPRKNYPRLLRALALARLRCPTHPVELTIVGRECFDETNDEMRRLVASIGGVTLVDHISDEAMGTLLADSHATAFVSWEEGFGLPVLESLWRGLPCLCHKGSSLAEVAVGGGTLMVDVLDDAAIADGIVRLVEDADLWSRLTAEAVARPIRDWDTYARDVLAAMARAKSAPGWSTPSISVAGRARPLLSCAITTYNRARWLRHTLPRLIDAAKPFGNAVEIVVCDNTSTDETSEVVARFAGEPRLTAHRNVENVGMLGNLGATARVSNGQFVWLIGDDDLILHTGLEAVLEGLERHSDVEMAYMNYAYTTFDAPEQLSDASEVIRGAKPIGFGGKNRRVDHLRDVAAFNENLFTAIYACAFRRDHALRAYQQDTRGAPFSSLATCVPSSTYALAALQDRPAWWVGTPAIVINMNVSWLRWALLWHLERMPDLFDMAELAGVDPVRLDRHRHKHCWNAGEWVRDALFTAEDAIRSGVSIERLIERCKHMPSFRSELTKVRSVYEEAWAGGRVVSDGRAPRDLFQDFGLQSY